MDFKATKLFADDGRIYQLEYAFKAISQSGMNAIAVRGTDSVVVCTQKKVPDKLIVAESVSNIFNVADGIGAVVVGNMNDARILIMMLRNEASQFKMKFFYEIPTRVLASRLGAQLQKYSQYPGIRTICATVTIVGCDEEFGPQCFRVDPSGSFVGYRAVATGSKEQEAMSHLERQFKKNEGQWSQKETVETAIKTLSQIVSSDFKANEVEVGIATVAQPYFRKLKESEIEEVLNEMADAM